MNHLQSVIDSLPQYHLRGKPLADMTLANIGEIVNYFKRKGNDALANQFYAYMENMTMNFDWQWKTRPMGFTLGANHSTSARRFWYEQNQLYAGRGW